MLRNHASLWSFCKIYTYEITKENERVARDQRPGGRVDVESRKYQFENS